MLSRNLTRRLERLEARLMPASKPWAIQICFVSPDGRVTDGPRYTSPGAGGRPTGSAGLAGDPALLVDSIAADWSNEDDRQ
jgi:hypothetical protein